MSSVYAQAADAKVGHLRTKSGDREIDFIVASPQRRGRCPRGEAVRWQSMIADVRHLKWLSDQLGPDLVDAAILTTGPGRLPAYGDNIAVIPVALLGPVGPHTWLRVLGAAAYSRAAGIVVRGSSADRMRSIVHPASAGDRASPTHHRTPGLRDEQNGTGSPERTQGAHHVCNNNGNA